MNHDELFCDNCKSNKKSHMNNQEKATEDYQNELETLKDIFCFCPHCEIFFPEQ